MRQVALVLGVLGLCVVLASIAGENGPVAPMVRIGFEEFEVGERLDKPGSGWVLDTPEPLDRYFFAEEPGGEGNPSGRAMRGTYWGDVGAVSPFLGERGVTENTPLFAMKFQFRSVGAYPNVSLEATLMDEETGEWIPNRSPSWGVTHLSGGGFRVRFIRVNNPNYFAQSYVISAEAGNLNDWFELALVIDIDDNDHPSYPDDARGTMTMYIRNLTTGEDWVQITGWHRDDVTPAEGPFDTLPARLSPRPGTGTRHPDSWNALRLHSGRSDRAQIDNISMGRIPGARDAQIGGTPKQGVTLTGQYTYIGEVPQGTSLFRWLRADAEDGEYTIIDGANEATYTPTAEDVGQFVKFWVTPVDSFDPPTVGFPVTSAATGPIESSDVSGPVAENVSLDGEPRVGATLTGTYDFTGESDLSTFRWLRADTVDGEYTAIDGATATTYTPAAADAGKFVKFEVTPFDGTNTGTVATSGPTGPVYVLGDFNGDGVLSGLDIPGFKQALADPDGWATANPSRPHPNDLGDFNGDGVFSGLDIPGFKQALAGQ